MEGMSTSDAELRLKADVRPLKEFVREELPVHSTYRAVVLAEPDAMDLHEYVGKVPLWTRLYRAEKR